MSKAIYEAAHFQDPDAAREYLEQLRWANGIKCPHCGVIGEHKRFEGKAHRPGVLKCTDCAQQFTVTVGTVFEDSKIPLHKWLIAAFMMASSKKGVSSKQIERTLGITYKSAWFMSHRLREAMNQDAGGLLGGGGAIVEADETYWGNESDTRNRGRSKRGSARMNEMNKIVSLVERNGKVRSIHVADVTSANLKKVLTDNIHADSHVMTDSSPRYNLMKREKPFAAHSQVNHSRGEYVRGIATTNTVEGFFSILKRGLIGTYHHVSSVHLHRYTNEFDFRYNHREKLGFSDTMRMDAALLGIEGKRLTYRA